LNPDPAPPAMDEARGTESGDLQGVSDPAPPRSLKESAPAEGGAPSEGEDGEEDDPVQAELDYCRRKLEAP
jgi:hypothetical protein